MAGSREYGSFDSIPLRDLPLRMTVSKYGAVRAGVGTGPYGVGNGSDHFIPLKMTVSKNGALVVEEVFNRRSFFFSTFILNSQFSILN